MFYWCTLGLCCSGKKKRKKKQQWLRVTPRCELVKDGTSGKRWKKKWKKKRKTKPLLLHSVGCSPCNAKDAKERKKNTISSQCKKMKYLR